MVLLGHVRYFLTVWCWYYLVELFGMFVRYVCDWLVRLVGIFLCDFLVVSSVVVVSCWYLRSWPPWRMWTLSWLKWPCGSEKPKRAAVESWFSAVGEFPYLLTMVFF